jgi:hypothetical protein
MTHLEPSSGSPISYIKVQVRISRFVSCMGALGVMIFFFPGERLKAVSRYRISLLFLALGSASPSGTFSHPMFPDTKLWLLCWSADVSGIRADFPYWAEGGSRTPPGASNPPNQFLLHALYVGVDAMAHIAFAGLCLCSPTHEAWLWNAI